MTYDDSKAEIRKVLDRQDGHAEPSFHQAASDWWSEVERKMGKDN